MWPAILAALRTYAPYVTLPAAVVIGFIGYNFENLIRGGRQQAYRTKSILEEREDRLLEHIDEDEAVKVDSLKAKKDIPRTVLNRNTPT